MSQHTLVIIGYTGIKRAYLDVSVPEAKRRWLATEGTEWDRIAELIDTITFDDEFCVYDAWEL